nr:secreted RxLR effector protein 161-like [Nicotiana tomentosiformis]
MIGFLLYLTASRPGIVFSVGICARFQAMESHLTIFKRILRYLKCTTDLYLWYPKGSNFNLLGHADADYAGFLVDRKRTSGMVVTPSFDQEPGLSQKNYVTDVVKKQLV